MELKVIFWYPSKLQNDVPEKIDYEVLNHWIAYLSGLGLNIMIPKNFLEIGEIYVDEKKFNQR